MINNSSNSAYLNTDSGMSTYEPLNKLCDYHHSAVNVTIKYNSKYLAGTPPYLIFGVDDTPLCGIVSSDSAGGAL